ncbi:MAG: hypothetical protein KF718_16435 [Polyangiaceae bacterium]|nr:hypothetical protein [Polyangiaceae bacterium]
MLLRSACALASLLVSSAALAQGYGQPGQQPYGQPQPGQPGLSSGGLAPPSGTSQSDQNSMQTQHELERADREDSGRGLEFFYINAEIGGEHLGLQTFKANNLVDAGVVKTSQTGLAMGAGLGVRLVFLTLGPRFRLASFEDWQLWTLNAELGIRIPLGNVEPYFTFGGGYASVGSFDSGNLGGNLNNDDVDITGYNLRGGFGIDLYLSPAFSIGANLTGEMLFLSRPGVDPSKLNTGTGSTDDVYAADGSSIGAGVTLTAVAGLHF